MTASHSASVMLVSMRSRRMPALLTRTSRPPKVSTADWIRRSAPSQSLMSSPLATASPPMATISSTTSWAGPLSLPSPSIVAAEVVDDDLGAVVGEQQRVLAADAPTRPGDDRDPSFVQPAHGGQHPSRHPPVPAPAGPSTV